MHYILAIIILVTSLYAKTKEFSIVVDEPFSNTLLDVTENYDRTISAVGFIKTQKSIVSKKGTTYTNAFDYLSSISNTHGSQIHLVKVDNQANITLRKSINLNNFNEAVSILKTPESGYYIGGYTLDGSLLILKLNSDGDIIFRKTFGTSNYDKMSNLILLKDGGVLAIGSSVTTRSRNDKLFESGLGLNDIYISRFSKDGIKLWSKKFGTEYDDKGIDATEANDGSIIVLSQTNHDKFKNISIMRLTENGDSIWLDHYRNEKLITPHKIIQLKDNNFVISLSQEDDMHKQQIRLMKFDIQKNILLDKIIHTTYASTLKDIKEYSDSKLIGVGYVSDTYNRDGLAMLLDSEFNMLQQEHFGEESYDEFSALTILHNSQAVAVGVHTDKDSQETNMWLVKLNKDISLAQTAPRATDFYKELCRVFKDEINSHKLIIKEDLSIMFIDKSLYFKTAQYKLTGKQEKFLKSFGEKLLPFLHVNKMLINTLEINGHTSSEWAGADFTNTYLLNEKLSMNRSFSTLAYMFKKQDIKTQNLLSNIIKGSGLNSSKRVILDEKEDREKSRRVSFKIILK
ncbi:hypothetical protein HUE87_02640 [Candidatus Sulfurimonas marisnigri]|uniref:OmpA-like domain-containing protein n=1 Tax=Candidatus Sulfurimonas marisnigri TaxID=2740405 RepID=A0A7S7RR52_9BACT|nr:hypothetical protein [Candidatus Sulfurimonas marisnigri]QOY55155.1 hypothetical protein HUE87_02640 [Candidatus Sulfurimonas marisnigri]